MKKLLGSLSVAFALSQLCASAHAPVVPFSFAHGYRAATHGFANFPVSGSSQAFAKSIKFITGTTIKNTVLNAPLTNVSGQFNAVTYYSFTSGGVGPFYNFPYSVAFGSNSLNTGSMGVVNGTNLSNSLSTVLTPIKIFPGSFGGHAVSGAQRALQGYYNSAATAGYNTGITLLQHPTGGLLYGTEYYNRGGTSFESYPGFQAFGNNPYASNAVAQANYGTLSLSQPLTSYIQFGKIIRPITNGFVFGTIYIPTVVVHPPYGPAMGPVSSTGYFGLAIGSHSLNTSLVGTYRSIPLNSMTYFK
jgi:hypothetical protein